MRFWIFQAVAEFLDLEQELTSQDRGIWPVTRYGEAMGEGDIAYLWGGGSTRGLFGAGVLLCAPYRTAITHDLEVRVSYAYPFARPLTLFELKQTPGLAALPICRTPHSRVFCLSESEALQINRLIRKKGLEPPPYPRSERRWVLI